MFTNSYRKSFANGYTASVCIGMYADGEFNVAVVDTKKNKIVYNTPVTSDTVRCETIEEVQSVLDDIEALPPIGEDFSEVLAKIANCPLMLSALVNMVDTVREGNADKLTYMGGKYQDSRERLILQYLSNHN